MLCLLLSVPAWAESQEESSIPTLQPETPTNITVSGITDATATVTWLPVATATQYSVYVNGEQYTASSSPAATLTGLRPFMVHDIYVVAHNSSGYSGQSSIVTFNTLPPAPSAPRGIKVSEVKKDNVKLSWVPNQPEEYIFFYRLYVDGRAVADVEPQEGIQAADLVNLSPGRHAVAVSALNENNESPLSTVLEFTCSEITAPAGFTMTNHSADQIWIQWEPVKNATTYSVFVDGNLIIDTAKTKFEINKLQENTVYTLSVCANLADGNKSLEANLMAKTLPAPVPLTLDSIKEDIFAEVQNIMPNIKILFVVICTFAITALLKLSFVRRVRW